MSDWCAKNCLRYCASANSLCTPSLSASVGISLIDWTLDVSTRSPLSVETCPMNGTSFSRIVSLYVLSVSPWSLQRPKDIMVAVGFFDGVATPNYTMKLSDITSIPYCPSVSSWILRWNTSGAEMIQNRSLCERYHPNEVWKIVRKYDASSSVTCQNTFPSSNLVNDFAPCNRVVTSSIVSTR